MKRAVALLLIITLILCFSSCVAKPIGNSTDDTELAETVIEEIEEIPPKNEIKAAVFWYDFSDTFLLNVRDALNAELDALGVEYENYDAAKTQVIQNEQIENAIENGANLLIVNIVDTAAIDAAQAITDKAKVADVPVIFFNREVDDSVINSYGDACFVGTRDVEAAEAQGIMIGQYLVDKYDAVDLNDDGIISYVSFKGKLGCPHCEAQVQYSVEKCNKELVSADKPEIEFIDPNNQDKFLISDQSFDYTYEMMTWALDKYPMESDHPIELIICCTDDVALGCLNALNDIGWNTGEESPSIPVFGYEHTINTDAAIEEGKLTGSILQSYEGMAKTISDLVENVINGEHVFSGAVDVFNVDEGVNKIRVPYEIKMKEEN